MDDNHGRILPDLSGHSALPSSGRSMLPPASLPKRRSTQNVVTAEDYEELRKHYTFVLPDKNARDGRPSTWQERMVEHYHSHLYKEFALADFSTPGKIGFCLRTKEEVIAGLGYLTCGNLRCPSFQQPELYINRKMAAQTNQLTRQGFPGPPYGEGLMDYEVPFQYVEHGETKLELVKVRLCKVCIPKLLDRSPGAVNKKRPAFKGPEINSKPGSEDANNQASSDSSSSPSSSNSSSSSSSNADETAALKESIRQRTKRQRKGKKEPRKRRASKNVNKTDDNGSTASDSSQEMGEHGDDSREQEEKTHAKQKMDSTDSSSTMDSSNFSPDDDSNSHRKKELKS